MESILVYSNVDIGFYTDRKQFEQKIVATPNTKEGRKLFVEYKKKNHWSGMTIYKRKISVEDFNKWQNKPILLEVIPPTRGMDDIIGISKGD